jgi:hypothetical protein
MDLLVSNELERMWKGAVMVWFEMSRKLSGKAEENYGKTVRIVTVPA